MMITQEQHERTKQWLKSFKEELHTLQTQADKDVFDEILINAHKSQIESLEKEVDEYERQHNE